ncbi:MAG TPA: glycosyltransferase [Candidatus Lokiarchaeia archaeon]|nr:glycosyltransferase [Candidatus Lokiarchaeia archaeon]
MTLCIGEGAGGFATYSHPTFRRYADQIGADFICIDTPKIKYQGCLTEIRPILFEKYQIYDILETYDRVLYMDTDILVTPHAPDIFEVVPYDQVAGVFEDFGMDMADRRARIRAVQDALGNLGWTEGYMNSGVFVVSKPHREAFRLYLEYPPFDCKYEQTSTNWYLRKVAGNILGLDYKWNYQGISRVFYGPPHRKAYFIHYAGGGIFYWIPKLDQIQADYEFFYGKAEE